MLFFVFFAIKSQQLCIKREEEIQQFLAMLDSGPIDHITLSKSTPGWELNLVDRDIVIKEFSKMDSIRDFILARKLETWQKPIAEWNVLLTFYFVGGNNFGIEIRKIENSTSIGRTHIYFQIGSCSDDLPSYSDGIGAYLEKIVKYDGRKFR